MRKRPGSDKGRAIGKAAFETGSYGDYISLGLLADRDTEACRYAEEIRAKLNAGREVTNIEMGQLAAAVYAEALGVGEKRAAEEAVQILAAAGMDTQRNPEGGLTPERNRGIVGVQEQADRKGVAHGTGEEGTRAIVGKEPAVPGEMEEEPGGVREASPGRTGTDPQQSAGIVRQSNTQRFNRIKSFSIVPEEGTAERVFRDTIQIEYGIPAYTIPADVFEIEFGKNAPALRSRNGEVLVKQNATESILKTGLPHEATHIMKQNGYAPYFRLLDEVPDYYEISNPDILAFLDS